jgi:type II secretory pathway component PulF
MKSIGSTMAFLGVFAIILEFLNRVPTLLMWIYTWGETTAWIIKIAFIVIGGILYFMGNKQEQETTKE